MIPALIVALSLALVVALWAWTVEREKRQQAERERDQVGVRIDLHWAESESDNAERVRSVILAQMEAAMPVEDLAAFIAGNLTGERRAAVLAHLAVDDEDLRIFLITRGILNEDADAPSTAEGGR